MRLPPCVAGACFQGEDHIAVILVHLVINKGNAVVGCIKASGDGHLGGALVAARHKVTGLAHRQIHGERFIQYGIRGHTEDGMTVVTFPQTGLNSSDADGRLVVIHHIHSGHLRLTPCVASAWLQGEDHATVRFIDLVIGHGNAVVGAAVAGGDGHLGIAQVARCHEATHLAHPHNDGEVL